MQASLASVADPREGNSSGPEPDDVTMTVQDRELADAKKRGLLVDIGDTDTSFPTSMLEFDCTRQKEMEEIDNWDIARGEEFRLDTDDDSDDDLLWASHVVISIP